MKKETILIALLGNRDLQFNKEQTTILEDLIAKKWINRHSDGHDFAINKSGKLGLRFVDISEKILEDFAKLKGSIKFPLISPILKEIGSVDQIIFCTSAQEPEYDKQDCVHLAAIAARYFQDKGIKCSQRLFTCSPVDLEEMTIFFNELFKEFDSEKQSVFVANAGGTPDMKVASRFAGVFEGFTYYSINARPKTGNGISKLRFEQQERLILKEIVEKMLAAYDYQGILNLPRIDDEIIKLCKKGLELYNFQKLAGIKAHENFREKSEWGIPLLLFNLKICFIQGRYAEVVGRIFRLEEAIGHYLLSIEFKKHEIHGTIPVETKGCLIFEDLIKYRNYINFAVYQHFRGVLQEKKGGFIFRGQTKTTNVGKNYWYYFCKAKSIYPEFTKLFSLLNGNYQKDNNPLANLRNKSILGHGFEGVSKANIEELTNGFDNFMEQISLLLTKNLGLTLVDPFEDINKEIWAIFK